MTIVFKIPRVGPRVPWAQGPALILSRTVPDREGGLGGPIPPCRTGAAASSVVVCVVLRPKTSFFSGSKSRGWVALCCDLKAFFLSAPSSVVVCVVFLPKGVFFSGSDVAELRCVVFLSERKEIIFGLASDVAELGCVVFCLKAKK